MEKVIWVTFKKTVNALYQKSPIEKGGFKYRVKSRKPFVKSIEFDNYEAFRNRNAKT